jgi:hypothetical protein
MTLSTTSPGDERTQFDYLLNSLEFAAQSENPARADYGGHRRRLFEYVRDLEARASTVQQVGAEWQPIASAPIGSEMFVARAFNMDVGTTPYTSDPWCVWQHTRGEFARWPHLFPPTHWLPLPSPKSSQGEQQ